MIFKLAKIRSRFVNLLACGVKESTLGITKYPKTIFILVEELWMQLRMLRLLEAEKTR
jgi:hypothetical protein